MPSLPAQEQEPLVMAPVPRADEHVSASLVPVQVVLRSPCWRGRQKVHGRWSSWFTVENTCRQETNRARECRATRLLRWCWKSEIMCERRWKPALWLQIIPPRSRVDQSPACRQQSPKRTLITRVNEVGGAGALKFAKRKVFTYSQSYVRSRSVFSSAEWHTSVKHHDAYKRFGS